MSGEGFITGDCEQQICVLHLLCAAMNRVVAVVVHGEESCGLPDMS